MCIKIEGKETLKMVYKEVICVDDIEMKYAR